MPQAARAAWQNERQRLHQAALRLDLLNPAHTLARGFALLQTPEGRLITQTRQTRPGQPLQAHLADGRLPLVVQNAPQSDV